MLATPRSRRTRKNLLTNVAPSQRIAHRRAPIVEPLEGRALLTGSPVTRLPLPDPTRLVAGADGGLWFGEPGLSSIGRITTDGAVTQFPTPNLSPDSIDVGAHGDIWFTDTSDAGTIDRLNTDGSISTFALPTSN